MSVLSVVGKLEGSSLVESRGSEYLTEIGSFDGMLGCNIDGKLESYSLG